MADVDQSRAERLKAARAEKYETRADACRAHGWPESRYGHHEGGFRNFDVDQAREYARAFGVPWDYLYFGSSRATLSTVATSGIPVVGDLSVGIWREKSAGGMLNETLINVPAGEDGRVGYRVTDNSADLAFQVGDIAIVAAAPPEIKDGDLVVIARARGDLIETSIRRVIKTPSATSLALHCKTRNAKDDLALRRPQNATRPSPF